MLFQEQASSFPKLDETVLIYIYIYINTPVSNASTPVSNASCPSHLLRTLPTNLRFLPFAASTIFAATLLYEQALVSLYINSTANVEGR